MLESESVEIEKKARRKKPRESERRRKFEDATETSRLCFHSFALQLIITQEIHPINHF